MTKRVKLDNIRIVLQKPRYPENIGSVARAMQNMGLNRLTVVAPMDFDLQRILRLATHSAADIVKKALISDNLADALAACHFVVGTTARMGRQRQMLQTPEKLAGQLVSISQNNRVAVVFGPEDKGLSNEELRHCHALVNIPTAEFSSINLAQAFNAREGFTVKDDYIAPKMSEPLKGGDSDGVSVPDGQLQEAQQLYFRMCGWTENGVPTRSKLEELGIGWVADLLSI